MAEIEEKGSEGTEGGGWREQGGKRREGERDLGFSGHLPKK